MNKDQRNPGGTEVVPLNQDGQETDSSRTNSYETHGITVAYGEESFLLESDQPDECGDNQRTSTPTKTSTQFRSAEDEQFPTQDVVLSPVLKSGAGTQHWQGSPPNHPSHSPGNYSTQDDSGEQSQSLYDSALSNLNSTITSDSYVTVKESVALSQFEVSLPQGNLHDESLGGFSTQDDTWETALGSSQGNSDLKDATIRHELTQSIVSSNVDDSNSAGGSASTLYEKMDSVVKDDQDSQQISNSHLHGSSPDRTTPEESSPDLELLNEICEEATNMTIKEALIYSLNPGVRAGLREGRLSLSESEILALEEYCQKFIDNLMSQLLDGHRSRKGVCEETHKPWKVEEKALLAQKLSSLGLETLKSNCDRFVQSIITEALHDSCFGFQNKDKKSVEADGIFEAKQSRNVSLKKDGVQTLLPLFKESEEIQDYIGFLSADIIKSALAKLSTSIATKNGEKNEHTTLNKNTSVDNRTEGKPLFCEHEFGTRVSVHDNDMCESESNAPSRGPVNKSMLITGDDNNCCEEQNVRETEGNLDNENMFSSSLNSGLELSLEFDAGEWEGGGLLEDFHSLDTGRKERIVLRELSFDEHADVAGTELLAPVFLAIAEENDDEIQGMRRKALSIEDLCGVIDEPVKEKSRPRSYSAPKRIRVVCQKAENVLIHEEDSGERQSSEGEDNSEGEGEDDDREEEEDDDGQIDKEQDKSTAGMNSNDSERFRWHTVSVNGREKVLDLKLLEPYMKVISHGGYFSDTKSTIVVIAACYLPDRSLANYDYQMEQLFFYVISTLELLAIHEDYYLVYLNGGTRQQNMPSVAWMKRFYQYIEGGLKKRMQEMFIVHPNFRLKVVITLAKPFLNGSFWRKLSFVHSLSSLSSHIPVDYIYIPDEVMRVDPAYRQVHNN